MIPRDGAVVLGLIADGELSEIVDRAAAAAGVRLVTGGSLTRSTWLAASAVVIDELHARRCTEAGGFPRRERVLVVSAGQPSSSTWSSAISIGAQGVCTLPAGEAELLAHLAEASEPRLAAAGQGRVIAVTAARGGAGASVFAAALALAAGEALLVDLDAGGGGIDLLLGAESTPGLRWPDLSGSAGGRLAWEAVRDALPHRRGVYLVSAARVYSEIAAGPLAAVLNAARRGGMTVICDVPRHLGAAATYAVEAADLVVLLGTSDVRGIAAAAALTGVVRKLNPNVGLVVRGPAPGGLRAGDVAAVAGIPLLAAMRPEPMLARTLEHGGLCLRARSPLTAAARAVLAVLGAADGIRAA